MDGTSTGDLSRGKEMGMESNRARWAALTTSGGRGTIFLFRDGGWARHATARVLFASAECTFDVLCFTSPAPCPFFLLRTRTCADPRISLGFPPFTGVLPSLSPSIQSLPPCIPSAMASTSSQAVCTPTTTTVMWHHRTRTRRRRNSPLPRHPSTREISPSEFPSPQRIFAGWFVGRGSTRFDSLPCPG
eukprot:scaffold47_cov334-Pavlova_lutheri.AAC.30